MIRTKLVYIFAFFLLFQSNVFGDLVISFANNDQLEGDVAGDSASFTDSMTGTSATLTTRTVTDSSGMSGGSLNPNAGSLGVSGGSSFGGFDGAESWSFDWDIGTTFLGIDLGVLSTSTESFQISSSDWIGLSGVSPGGSSSYDSATGTFTLTNFGGSDVFTLGDISGGVALDLAAGSDITIAYSDTASGNATIQGLTFGVTAVPEPSSLAWLGVVGVGLVLRRRKN